MKTYTITHRTAYYYSSAATLCHNEARLLPRQLPWQQCTTNALTLQPKPAVLSERLDFFGNRILYIAIQDIHHALEVTVTTTVQVQERPFSPATPSPAWEEARKTLHTDPDPEIIEARQFVLPSAFIAVNSVLRNYALPSFPPKRPLLEAVKNLTSRIYKDFTYDPQFTTVATPLSHVLENRRGVCQDFAHLQIGCLRALGLAARYVSGYLETTPPPGQPRLVGADASHAWIAVYLPGSGWAEFDPTNDCMAGEKHITIGWGRDYGDMSPLKGIMSGGGKHRLEVGVDVLPLAEVPKSSEAIKEIPQPTTQSVMPLGERQ